MKPFTECQEEEKKKQWLISVTNLVAKLVEKNTINILYWVNSMSTLSNPQINMNNNKLQDTDTLSLRQLFNVSWGMWVKEQTVYKSEKSQTKWHYIYTVY